MAEILTIGRFYKTDADGYIVNESSIDNIVDPWKQAVVAATENCIDHFRERLQSLYLRGSIPRGLGIEGASDIDLIVLLYDDAKILSADQKWATTANQDLKKVYPFATDFEFAVAVLGDYLVYDIAKVTVKSRACLIYGEDIAQHLPPVKVDRTLAKALDFMLQESLKHVEVRLGGKAFETLESREQRWIMKRILRSGMTAVLERVGRFSPDLYPQYRCFIEIYPEHEAFMRRALEIAINADLKSPGDDAILGEFAPWLVQELKRHGLP